MILNQRTKQQFRHVFEHDALSYDNYKVGDPESCPQMSVTGPDAWTTASVLNSA